MKEFDVTITETLEKNVKVEAESRQEAEDAVKLVREASCIFLMGGNATLQMKLKLENF